MATISGSPDDHSRGGAVSIGGHHFDPVDVRRTVAEAVDLVEAPGLGSVERSAALAERRSTVRSIVGAVDAWKAPADQVVDLLRRLWPVLTAVSDDLAAADLLPVRSIGTVASLHVGSGGVPKPAVDAVEIDLGGVIGDRQATRRHHGAPWQAVCLWSVEVIDELRADGHPIGPGYAGENVTIAGLDWADVRPGVRLRIGSVLCRVSSFAVPCKQNASWFADGDCGRIHHRNGPVSRVYATVLEPGRVTTGDEVVVEP
ncbi:MAG: MOSC domain-containing protein [Ilumatobacteraceae bacterium]